MLSKTQTGYYKIRFRVNPKLESFFKKKEINKVLNTNVYEIAKVKADIIRQKYQDLLKVSRVLERKQIQELIWLQ
ncbi:hypothetical protein OZZ08_08970 [Malaciobacter mytili]|uniref:hypothetical protein n=1 Tax=Malaciobacter mytili TaxID=603050 RepID=UPI003BB217DB